MPEAEARGVGAKAVGTLLPEVAVLCMRRYVLISVGSELNQPGVMLFLNSCD